MFGNIFKAQVSLLLHVEHISADSGPNKTSALPSVCPEVLHGFPQFPFPPQPFTVHYFPIQTFDAVYAERS